MIGQTVSHYKIVKKLGEGGMGEVYLAEDLNLGRKVAVKFLFADKAADPEARKRFIHEARAQALVLHTNVTSFYEVGEEDKVFIVMEYVEGQKLGDLAKTEKLSLSEILDLAIQVGEGLQAAHEKGVMHRDINPANILVTSKGVAKITDFGLAKWKGASTITMTGLQMGTDSYMSPEQLEGRKADFRTDIFSFGVVLYELICARRPFEGNNRETLFYEILYTPPQPLARFCRGVPEGLERLVMKCLAKKPEERYQSMADLVADMKKERKSNESGKRILPKTKKWLPILVPAGIGLAVLLFLIFKPFSIEIGTDKESAAAENSLAVMYFENLADPEDRDKTAQMITSLLITGLSESENLSVISRQRLYDILNLMGKGDVKVIDRRLASEVAKKAGVKWILTGEVLQTKPNLVVTGEVSEVRGGRVLSSQRLAAAPNDDIFAVADKLGWDLKKNLSLPLKADTEKNKSVAEVTTQSPEAYRYYLEGMDYEKKWYWSEAERSYRKALNFDSTFALAYYQLSGIVGGKEGKSLIGQAVKYSDKVSQKDKDYIKAREVGKTGDKLKYVEALKNLTKRYPGEKEAFYLLGSAYRFYLKKPKEGIPYLIKAIEIDPLYKMACNDLAYAYSEAGDFEKAIQTINKYIEIAPGEANPYDSRAEIYANNGKIELAIESYKKAVEIKSDFYESWERLGDQYALIGQLDQALQAYKKVLEIKPDRYQSLVRLGDMHVFKREYPQAESCYRELFTSSDKSLRSRARLRLAAISLYQGKFKDALALLDQGLATDKMEQPEDWTASKHWEKAYVYEGMKNLKMALEEMEKAIEIHRRLHPDRPRPFRARYVRILAATGNFSKAESEAQSLKKDIEKKDPSKINEYWYAIGCIEWAKGNKELALTHFEEEYKEFPDFYYRVIYANYFLEAGRLGEAVAELEKVLNRYDDTRAGIFGGKIYYLLGLAYEKSGWNQKAIEKYQEFLEIWKNADPGIAEVADAKARLAKLKQTASK